VLSTILRLLNYLMNNNKIVYIYEYKIKYKFLYLFKTNLINNSKLILYFAIIWHRNIKLSSLHFVLIKMIIFW